MDSAQHRVSRLEPKQLCLKMPDTLFLRENISSREGEVSISQNNNKKTLKKKKKNTVGDSKYAGCEGRGPDATRALCLWQGCRPEQEVAADTEEGPF